MRHAPCTLSPPLLLSLLQIGRFARGDSVGQDVAAGSLGAGLYHLGTLVSIRYAAQPKSLLDAGRSFDRPRAERGREE